MYLNTQRPQDHIMATVSTNHLLIICHIDPISANMVLYNRYYMS